jgi:hypothetical protein
MGMSNSSVDDSLINPVLSNELLKLVPQIM